jgi:uncharacterized protein
LRSAALTAYLDSSGLVKLLIRDEVGGALVRGIIGPANRTATSIVTYAESRAAIAAAVRGGRMDVVEGRQAVDTLDEIWSALVRLTVDEALVRLAGSLTDRHRLRGFDAIHLASALSLGVDTAMVSWDKDLARAAHDEGLVTIPAWR